jgi:hypothetical protein
MASGERCNWLLPFLPKYAAQNTSLSMIDD